MTLGVNESAKPRLHPQRHASQELLSSHQTLLRARISQQDQVYIIQNANQELSSSCQTLLRERTSQQNHDYILQRHENQELSNSCQTLLRERTSQQNHDYILQRHENQELSNSCQTLLRERTSQQNHDYILQRHENQELSNSCHTLLRERTSQQNHDYILQRHEIKSFQTPAKPCSESGRVSKTTTTSFKDMKSRAFKLLPHLAQRADESTRPLLHHSNMQSFGPMPNLAEGTESQQDHDYIIQNMQIKSS